MKLNESQKEVLKGMGVIIAGVPTAVAAITAIVCLLIKLIVLVWVSIW